MPIGRRCAPRAPRRMPRSTRIWHSACRVPAARRPSPILMSKCARPAPLRARCSSLRRRQNWGVPESEITVVKGLVNHNKSGEHARFAELADQAAKLAPPQNVKLKDPSKFTLIGTTVPKLDTRAKSDGSAIYTIDGRSAGDADGGDCASAAFRRKSGQSRRQCGAQSARRHGCQGHRRMAWRFTPTVSGRRRKRAMR